MSNNIASEYLTEDSIVFKSLPRYLQNDLKALNNGYESKPSYLDCLYNEVQGSINAAFHNKEISYITAEMLREAYL
ncbi:MAG: hypothetical protein LBC71_04510 [Oscillospiraceae bacterium]|nr:hypothetical protein [Oscillospiraceae bacterium]